MESSQRVPDANTVLIRVLHLFILRGTVLRGVAAAAPAQGAAHRHAHESAVARSRFARNMRKTPTPDGAEPRALQHATKEYSDRCYLSLPM